MGEQQHHEAEPSTAAQRATADLHDAKQAWQEMSQRLAALEAEGVHRSDPEEDEFLRLKSRIEAYPAHLSSLQRAVELAFDTTRIDQVTAAAPATIAAVVEDHQDLHAWWLHGMALAKRWRGHRLELEQLLAQLPRVLHERVTIGTVDEVIRSLPTLLRVLMEDGAGWLVEATLSVDKGAHPLPANLYERYREAMDLQLKREASMRAAAEESGVSWTTVYESRTGRPVPMRSTDAAEALAIGHHQAEPPQWATA